MIQKDFDLFDKELFDKDTKINFAYLFGAAIILDAHNFDETLRDSKWTNEDEKARDFFNNFTTLDATYYDRMELNKHDAEMALGLGFQGNLRRDYKQYGLEKDGHKGVFGIAVIVATWD